MTEPFCPDMGRLCELYDEMAGMCVCEENCDPDCPEFYEIEGDDEGNLRAARNCPWLELEEVPL